MIFKISFYIALVLLSNKSLYATENLDYTTSGSEIVQQRFLNYAGHEALTYNFFYSPVQKDLVGFVAKDQFHNTQRHYFEKDYDHFQGPNRKSSGPKIAVIDSGFELQSEFLFPHLSDPLVYLNAENPERLPLEPLVKYDLGKSWPLFSHGTFTASIALKGLSSATLYPISGDLRFYNLDLLKDFFNKHAIDIVNMSFYLPKSKSSGPSRRGRSTKFKKVVPLKAKKLSKIISLNPNSLWIAASGNGPLNLGIGVDIDQPQSASYPASLPNKNLLVVGSVNSSKIAESKLHTYQVSNFGNTGKDSVDIFAPGKGLEGASWGGGTETGTGTSFSAPYVTNLAAKIKSLAPKFSPHLIIKIILTTAYLKSLEKPLPCKSGGIVFPKRALKLARLLKKSASPEKDFIRLVFLVRASNPVKGEANPTKKQLLSFWRERQITNNF